MAAVTQIPDMANAIQDEFAPEGYDIQIDTLMNGGRDISITKGGIFKAVLGMRSALKITLTPQMNGVLFDARVGIFGHIVIPAFVAYFFFWPVIITQVWGLINQSKLDDRALAAAERSIHASASPSLIGSRNGKYCTQCGANLDDGARFCSRCGAKIG